MAERVANRDYVYLEISIEGGTPARIVLELFSDIVPSTSANFKALCTGEKGHSTKGTKLHYADTPGLVMLGVGTRLDDSRFGG